MKRVLREVYWNTLNRPGPVSGGNEWCQMFGCPVIMIQFELGGKWVELPVMGSFEIRDGLISHWRDYFEMKQFTDQMPTG